MTEEKRTDLRVGSSGFISLNLPKMDFSFQGVSDVLMELPNDKSTVIGGVSGALSFGVGQLASQMFTGICASTSTLTANQVSWIVAAPQAVMHGLSQGWVAGISGGDIGQAFFSAMISSGVSSTVQMGGNSFMGNGDAATLLFGTVSGGLSAELTGGNFWQGAATGLTVSWLNHTWHKYIDPKKYTIAALADTEGANGAGHQAYAGDHPDGTTKYVSKDGVKDLNGDGKRDNGGVYGESAYTIKGDFSSMQDVLNAYPEYDSYVTFKVTGSQARMAYNAAVKSAKSYYLLVGASCVDVVSAALNAAFWKDPTIYFHRESSIPNVRFIQYKEIYYFHSPTYNK